MSYDADSDSDIEYDDFDGGGEDRDFEAEYSTDIGQDDLEVENPGDDTNYNMSEDGTSASNSLNDGNENESGDNSNNDSDGRLPMSDLEKDWFGQYQREDDEDEENDEDEDENYEELSFLEKVFGLKPKKKPVEEEEVSSYKSHSFWSD
jgi:hypothetical protein